MPKNIHAHPLWLSVIMTLSLLGLTACNSIIGYLNYRPPLPVPLSVTIDTRGHVTVSLEGHVLTSIGTFSPGVTLDMTELLSGTDGILTVRVDGIDTIYDLAGSEIDIHLDSGFYREIALRKDGKNWFLEAVRMEMEMPSELTAATPDPASQSLCEEFNDPTLDPRWSWIDPRGDSSFSLSDQPGFLRISVHGSDHDLYQNLNAPRLLQELAGDFSVTTMLTIAPTANYQGAGLLFWQDENNYVRLERTLVQGIDLLYRIQGDYHAVEIPFTSSTVFLRFTYAEGFLTGLYSEDGATWIEVKTLTFPSSGRNLVGLVTVNEWQEASIFADFDFFHLGECP